jgi:DMSO/TMAO reductase YedYZ molybdopterin-dependent catalytic subunit
MTRLISRRQLITSIGAGSSSLLLLGGNAWADDPTSPRSVLSVGEWLAYRVHRFIGGSAMAPEYTEADMSPVFRTNGNTMPASAVYRRHAVEQFASWRLEIRGMVAAPKSYSLAELQAMPSRTQITRHDCVEGWSAIGKWTGVQLGYLLKEAQINPRARFIVFHCADDFDGENYYESIDLADAYHPQTILAYRMNDDTLSIGHGAPVRLRVERQLGYKHAKYIMRIEAVSALSGIGRGRGGFWEDTTNYDWYAGI